MLPRTCNSIRQLENCTPHPLCSDPSPGTIATYSLAVGVDGSASGHRTHAMGRADDGRNDGIGAVHRIPVSARSKGPLGGDAQVMNPIHDAASLVRGARRKLSTGELSREPLRLLRLEWVPECVECDWLMRAADPWDDDLPPRVARENQTLQALRDALDLRRMIFRSFPSVMNAELRMYRDTGEDELELMMTGSVSRTNEVLERVASVVMRARLCGFHFTLASGVLQGPSGSW